MNSTWAVTLITFKEGLRHRIISGIIISALLVILISIFISGLFMRDLLKILLDICLSSVSVGGLLVPVFLAVTFIAGDIERKTIYTILAKPVPRKSYIWGKFLAISLLAGCVITILTFATLIAVYCAKLIHPVVYFSNYSLLPILLSSLMAFAAILVLNSCAILWCSITTSSFLATLLIISTYVVGQSIEDIVHFISLKADGVQITPMIEFTTKVTLYIFPNLAAFDFKQLAAHGVDIPAFELVYLSAYACSYSTVILLLATLCFNRRELT